MINQEDSEVRTNAQNENFIFKKVSVVGLGYIGLPTAAMFASRYIEVVGIDVNTSVVGRINKGEIHIVEPGLDIMVRSAITSGYLRATMKAEPADAFLVAVPTPFKGDNREPDLSYIEAAVRAIASVLEPGNLVVLESTSPVGATEQIAAWLAEERPELTFPQTHGNESDIRIAYCPERVLPGNVIQELISNDRLIGGLTDRCSQMAANLYKTFVLGDCVITSSRAAELTKLTENSFRDVNIAFANEMSVICDHLNIDVWEVIELANRHPRVNILRPGPGVGGHCIAVDPWFIVSAAPEKSRIIRAAREINDSKPRWVIARVDEAIEAFLKQDPRITVQDVTVACYGLAFKPDTDDLRESPALYIVKKLASSHEGHLLAIEPNINQIPADLGRAKLVSMNDALQLADIHVYLVAHREFKASLRPPRFVIDTVGM